MNKTKPIQNFLKTIDTFTGYLGLNEPIVSLEYLKSLPQGTFGRAMFDFLSVYKLKPLKGIRRKQLHDCIHTITGYGADLIGEAEVQAFMFGSESRPFHLILTLAITQKVLKNNPFSHQSTTKRLMKAYRRGINSSLNVDIWLPETQWLIPLNKLQQQYNLQ